MWFIILLCNYCVLIRVVNQTYCILSVRPNETPLRADIYLLTYLYTFILPGVIPIEIQNLFNTGVLAKMAAQKVSHKNT